MRQSGTWRPLCRAGALATRLPGEVPAPTVERFGTARPKLYRAMGISRSPCVLRDIIEIVSGLHIQSLIVTTTILPEREGKASGHVLLTPHAPAHGVDPLADVAFMHGGAGTVQTAIHSGTPLVGIPMHLEHTGNLSLVTRPGAGLMLSKWDLNRRSLDRALESLLADASLRENMLRLKALQDKVEGSTEAAREIVSFLGASKPSMEQAR